jgi:hypothetical protein
LQRLEATEQGRALGGGSRTLVLKDFLALRAFQGGELQGRVLLLGRDAGVTVFHARDYETSNLKHPSPLFTGLFGVFHNLPVLKRLAWLQSGREFPKCVAIICGSLLICWPRLVYL